jgi:hypothetical protein
MSEDRANRWFAVTWWIVCPACALLVARFSYERACLNPYELLQPVMRHQAGALLVAAIYVAVHVWFVAAIVLAARAWNASYRLKGQPVAIDVDSKLVAMGLVLAVEQVPRAVWAWLYHTIGAC